MTTKTKELIKSGIHTAALVTQTPILDEGDVESKRQEILDYFHDTFTLYESLFECLADDDAFCAVDQIIAMVYERRHHNKRLNERKIIYPYM